MTRKTKVTKTPETPETPATPEVKTPKGEYRVVGIYLGQQIDRVYTDKAKADEFCAKIGGKII